MRTSFSGEVRHALARTREEAQRLGHHYIGTEHILLGMIRGSSPLPPALMRLRVDPELVRQEVERRVSKSRHPGRHFRPSGPVISKGEIPYRRGAMRVLEYAIEEADLSGERNVDNLHLLLGLLREERGIAAQVLQRLGITRAALTGAEQESSTSASLFRVTIDDCSSSSIYEQIIAQVTEVIATGELKPGDRLPTVRQLADDADIAPGTVARAYSQLERDGVVITEGARGTRVAERKIAAVPAAERPELLGGLLRPVAVAAFHLGATADELQEALLAAMKGIYDKSDARE